MVLTPRSLRWIAAAAAGCLMAAQAVAQDASSASAVPADQDLVARPGQTTTGAHGMVATVHVLASQVGADILRQGGNAVDAAVAVGFALEVVYPYAGNLGGGGFMLVHTSDGRNEFVDYRETAPLSARHDMYLGQDGKPLPMRDPRGQLVGWRASGTPGTVAGLALALQKFGSGKLTWAQLIEPARKLAADGFILTKYGADQLTRQAKGLAAFPETKRIYLKNGLMYRPGDRFVQPELAETLARLQAQGPREFYEGETARRIAAAMAANHGTLTLEDLKRYRAVVREPVVGHYRKYDIVTAPPPSSGGVAILQILGMLEPYDIYSLGVETPQKYHLFIEAMRRAYRDRAAYMGDPDFVKVPVKGLLDHDYVQSLMKNYDPEHATPSEGLEPGKPGGMADHESHETTQFTIVDAQGGAISNTYTLNAGFGSGVTIPGTGLLMNDEMGDFAAKPGTANAFGLIQGEADAIAPGKRPLSSMSPTFVFRRGQLYFATGSPGGATIINTVVEIVTNVIDHGMTMADAVAERRFNHQWMPDEVTFEAGLDPATDKALTAMGYKLKVHNSWLDGSFQGDGESVMIDLLSGARIGAADPRKPDARAIGF